RARPADGPPVSEDLSLLDATAQAELVRTGQVSPAELVTAAIERIEALNPVLNAVVTPVFERAAEQARAVPGGPFAGVPYLVKDLACEMEGVRFTEGSRFLADHVSAFDSELVLRLRRAGLVILGKSNTPEFGMAPACEPVLFGPTRNPWDTQRSTSGSSGGSAAAVASGMVPFAHGNDLGGAAGPPVPGRGGRRTRAAADRLHHQDARRRPRPSRLRRGRRARRAAVFITRPRGQRDGLAGVHTRNRRGHRHDDQRGRLVD